jgi:ketosteroid isomerase-like protein
MRPLSFIVTLIGPFFLLADRERPAAPSPAEEVIALERMALDRWGRGDPSGFLEIYAPEITYFDVATERRLEGHAALTDYVGPLRGRINIPRYEMIAPRVQGAGETAVLTYNLISEGILPDGQQVTVRWNSTSVYARQGRQWKVIHSHWSLTAPPCLRGAV